MKTVQWVGRWLLLLSFGLAVTGCAHHAIQNKQEKKPDPTSISVTGSHIKQPIDNNTNRTRTTSPIRSYSKQEIEQTGQVDVGRALQRLCPSLQVSGPASKNLR